MLPIPLIYTISVTPEILLGLTFSYDFMSADFNTSPYWYSRYNNLTYEYYGANDLWLRQFGTSSSPLQTDNVFGPSVPFSDGDIYSVETPGMDYSNSTLGRAFIWYNMTWSLDATYTMYMNVNAGLDDSGNNAIGTVNWMVNGSVVKQSNIPAGFGLCSFKLIWNKSTKVSYTYIGDPKSGYNTLIGTYSMDPSVSPIGATNSLPFFFSGMSLSPTQSTSVSYLLGTFPQLNNGFIISNVQFNGLTGSNRGIYNDPTTARINVKF